MVKEHAIRNRSDKNESPGLGPAQSSEPMSRQVHVFDNGVRVFDDQLVPGQKDRYAKRNVHEAEEEDLFIEIIRSIPPDGCFVDVGSAIGYYVLLAKKLAPDLVVHAIEPLERYRLFFLENLDLNRLTPGDFSVHKEGISSSEGDQQFIDNGYGSSLYGFRSRNVLESVKSLIKRTIKLILTTTGIRRFDLAPKGIADNQMITVQTITLDHLMGIVGRRVDLLQMDVQGAEADILRSSLSTLQSGNIKTFLVGTHGRAVHQECKGILQEYGYKIEYDEPNPKEQPDGIIVASKGTWRLKTLLPETSTKLRGTHLDHSRSRIRMQS